MMQNALASKLSADNAMILHDTLKLGISRLAYRCSVVWQWPVDHLQSNANIRLHVSRALSLSKTFKNSERSMTVFQFSSFSFLFSFSLSHQTIMVSTFHASENNSWVSWSNSIKVVAFSEKTRWPRRKLPKETNLGIVHKDPESFTILFLEIS